MEAFNEEDTGKNSFRNFSVYFTFIRHHNVDRHV